MKRLFENWRKFLNEDKCEEDNIEENFLKKFLWHSGDAATTAKGVSDDDEIMTLLGLSGFVFTSPISAATITLSSFVYGNAKQALEEFNNLPDDHPRKIAHRKYVEACPNCHRLSGKSREQAEIASGLITAELAKKKNWKSDYIEKEIKRFMPVIKNNPEAKKRFEDPKKRKEALDKLQGWIKK